MFELRFGFNQLDTYLRYEIDSRNLSSLSLYFTFSQFENPDNCLVWLFASSVGPKTNESKFHVCGLPLPLSKLSQASHVSQEGISDTRLCCSWLFSFVFRNRQHQDVWPLPRYCLKIAQIRNVYNKCHLICRSNHNMQSMLPRVLPRIASCGSCT